MNGNPMCTHSGRAQRWLFAALVVTLASLVFAMSFSGTAFAAQSDPDTQVDPGLVRQLDLSLRTTGGADTLSSPEALAAIPGASANILPSTGTVKVLTLLIDFSDYSHYSINTTASISDKIFDSSHSTSRSGYPYDSVTNFYWRSSYGKLSIQGNVLGWYRSSQPRSAINPNGNYDDDPAELSREQLIKEALDYYEAQGVDFSQYDSNQDGTIDSLAVVWSGPATGWHTFWWGYKREFRLTQPTYDGVHPAAYTWQWECGDTYSAGAPFSPRTLIHESGHLLGLPDIYDKDTSTGPSGGVGGFDMMGENSDYDHNGFSKWLLGWTRPTIVPGTALASLQAPNSVSATSGVVVWPNATEGTNVPFGEFFYIENREPVGNDVGMATNPSDGKGGVVIWHVDGTLATDGSFAFNNSDTAHKLIKFVEAPAANAGIENGAQYSYRSFYYPGGLFNGTTTPNSHNYSGADTGVEVAVNERSGNDISVTAGIAGQAPNSPPVAGDDTAATAPNTPVTISVLANDSDVDGDALTVSNVANVTNGTATINVNNTVTLTPSTGFTGSATFDYTVSDGNGGTDTGTVTVEVGTANHAPVAVADAWGATQDTALTVAAPGVLANDTDADANPLTAALVSGPAHGTLTLSASGGFVYTPPAAWSGTDSFTYRAYDGQAYSSSVTVTITVSAPFSYVGHGTETESASTNSAVCGKPSGVQVGDLLVAVLFRYGAQVAPTSVPTGWTSNGSPLTGAIASSNTYLYWKVADGTESSSLTWTWAASGIRTYGCVHAYRGGFDTSDPVDFTTNVPYVTIDRSCVLELTNYTVSAANSPVIAVFGSQSSSSNTRAFSQPTSPCSFTADYEHATLKNSYSRHDVQHGIIASAGRPSSDAVSLITVDGGDYLSSTKHALGIVLNPPSGPPVPRAPVASSDAYAVAPGTTLSVPAPGVLGNDTDANGDSLSASLVSQPAHGTAVLSANGAVVYTPVAGFAGTDSFTYKASDGALDSNIATVTIDIRGTVKIVALGDSNTDGTSSGYTSFAPGQGSPWPTRLRAALAAAYPSTTYVLDNQGVSGTDSGDGYADRAAFAALGADIYVVMYGTNDAHQETPSSPSRTTAEFTANMTSLLSELKNAHAANNFDAQPLVLVMQPPPAISKTVFDAGQTSMPYWRLRDSSEMASGNLVDMKNACLAISQSLGIPVVPVWDSTAALGFDGSQTNRTTQSTYLYDGVHVSGAEQDEHRQLGARGHRGSAHLSRNRRASESSLRRLGCLLDQRGYRAERDRAGRARQRSRRGRSPARRHACFGAGTRHGLHVAVRRLRLRAGCELVRHRFVHLQRE